MTHIRHAFATVEYAPAWHAVGRGAIAPLGARGPALESEHRFNGVA